MIDLPIDNNTTAMDVAFYEQKAKKNSAFICILKAASHLNIHPDYIYTIWKLEGGTTGSYNRNKSDGTHDIGDMQINYETWAKEFIRLGFRVDWKRVLNNQCDNFYVGSKIIKLRLNNAKTVFTGLSNYHWYSTAKNSAPHYVYKKKLIPVYRSILKDKATYIKNQSLTFNISPIR